jgi:hypothetical protein
MIAGMFPLFNLMLYLFIEDWKQPEGYTVGLRNIHMIQNIIYKTRQDKTRQQTHSLIIVKTNYIFNSNLKYVNLFDIAYIGLFK